MNDTKAELLFLGLPETGKTTFFVALDEVIQRQSNKHGLTSGGFAVNRAYIEDAKKLWRAGKPVHRTNQTSNETVELLVKHDKTSTCIRLSAPDVSGEFFDAQWSDRRWPISYKERLALVSGLFVFINSAFNGRNTEITEAWLKQSESASCQQAKPWNVTNAAKQVKLVELLQFISERGQIRKPLPLAMMISAWDLIEPRERPSTVPDMFLQNEWSLLHQYLHANPECFKSRIYGVSAMGGDENAQAKLSLLNPHERVWLKDGKEVTSDLTRPLRWLLSFD